MNIKKISIAICICLILAIITFLNFDKKNSLPLVAIANYGPHTSLFESIAGIKSELTKQGFIENQTVRFEIVDVGFDQSLIPQMITKLKSANPHVMVVMGTPIAQFAKNAIKDISLVYNVVTDPVNAGLIQQAHTPDANMTGSSDKQDLNVLLEFAQKLLPHAKRVGLLYATSDSNDLALVQMMQVATNKKGMTLLAIPVANVKEVPIAMQRFKDKVDFLYVGVSGPIQPSLPTIASESHKMRIPLFNVEESGVKEGLVLASFGVSYKQVGVNAGKQIAALLKGSELRTLSPLYPSLQDHHALINMKVAKTYGVVIPENLTSVETVE